MRQVVSLSLQSAEARQIKKIAQKRGFGSVSSYVNYLLKADENLISETELLKTVRASRAEYRVGKSIKAKSLADLV
ncbi:MAG: hypothetical protein PHY40_03505 [Patescibacteria group bacterium]|nr:hypothetical protein [Patescibacteria group bacterium]